MSDLAAGRIIAVLDWELCTLGDPLADLGYLGVYWSDGGSRGRDLRPDGVGGFGTFDDVSSGTRSSALATSDINFYVAFQMWRRP